MSGADSQEFKETNEEYIDYNFSLFCCCASYKTRNTECQRHDTVCHDIATAVRIMNVTKPQTYHVIAF